MVCRAVAAILRLLDPSDEAPRTSPLRSSGATNIRTVGRTPNAVWGAKLMWNQTPLLVNCAKNLPNRSGDGPRAAIRDVVSQAVSFWRAVQMA
jgi:LPS sulfotransferase NodH